MREADGGSPHAGPMLRTPQQTEGSGSAENTPRPGLGGRGATGTHDWKSTTEDQSDGKHSGWHKVRAPSTKKALAREDEPGSVVFFTMAVYGSREVLRRICSPVVIHLAGDQMPEMPRTMSTPAAISHSRNRLGIIAKPYGDVASLARPG